MSFPAPCRRAADECAGSALVVVLMATLLLSAVGLATVMLATADTAASSNQRDARAALFAAEAGIELAAAELAAEPDWDGVLSGSVVSAFADGTTSGARVLPGGGSVQPLEVASAATCGAATGCSAAARQALTDDRPWGANNPCWRPYRFGPIAAGGTVPDIFVVVLVGDDPAESDGDPARDGQAPGNRGAGVVVLRAEAFGPGASRRSVEAAMVRVAVPSHPPAPRFLSWREVR
jgi:hypothetical protein